MYIIKFLPVIFMSEYVVGVMDPWKLIGLGIYHLVLNKTTDYHIVYTRLSIIMSLINILCDIIVMFH